MNSHIFKMIYKKKLKNKDFIDQQLREKDLTDSFIVLHDGSYSTREEILKWCDTNLSYYIVCRNKYFQEIWETLCALYLSPNKYSIRTISESQNIDVSKYNCILIENIDEESIKKYQQVWSSFFSKNYSSFCSLPI